MERRRHSQIYSHRPRQRTNHPILYSRTPLFDQPQINAELRYAFVEDPSEPNKRRLQIAAICVLTTGTTIATSSHHEQIRMSFPLFWLSDSLFSKQLQAIQEILPCPRPQRRAFEVFRNHEDKRVQMTICEKKFNSGWPIGSLQFEIPPLPLQCFRSCD